MGTTEGFPFFPLTFDQSGEMESRGEFDAMIKRAKTAPVATDVIFLAHGFRNDTNDATTLYNTFLKTFRAHLSRPEFSRVAERHFVVAGVYWPSKPFREVYTEQGTTRGLENPATALANAKARLEDFKRHDATPAQRRKLDKAIKLLPKLEGSPKAQDDFVDLVLGLVDNSELDATEGLPQVRTRSGSELLARLSAPTAGTRTRGIGDMLGNVAGGLGQFLNLTTWYVMKDRSGVVGSVGVARAVREFHAACPKARIHLVGHSLGGRLMAGCVKALGETPRLHIDSLMLLEAAFSHFGFSADNGRGEPGFFRDVIVNKVVKGPFVSTFSTEDTVVGRAYAVMSRLARDNTRGLGDKLDEYGGIGRNGPLQTDEVSSAAFRKPGMAYKFKPGVINNLDGSGGFIKDHSDVTNEAVTYAFASAVAQTQ